VPPGGLDSATTFVKFESETSGRWAKLNIDTLSPYAQTLYMDADTRVMSADIVNGFNVLDCGYDMALAPSENQAGEFLSHSTEDDKNGTRAALINPDPLQLQAGVFFVTFNDATRALWTQWRREWQSAGGGQDQGALLRAMDKAPVKLWLLSFDWNSRHGSIVEHHFGEAR
jgi:hypothetical protein